MYNNYFYIIIAIFVVFYLVDKFIDYLNTLNWNDKLPEDVKDFYDEQKYAKSQSYEKTKHNFKNISWIFSFFVTLIVLWFWWFWLLDIFLRTFIQNDILLTLVFFWIVWLINLIIWIPFSYYATFVIEEKFWFNKSTKKIFFLDIVKSIILTTIIWGLILSLITFLYLQFQNNFWIYAWILLSLFSIFIMMFYSSLIVPLFNKQTPLEDWDLKTAINNFATKVWFKLDNIYVIDGSKRSSKANAYFSGLWPKKRIVLYDTLINDLSIDELVAVLAHEIGHYKHKHTFIMLSFSLLQTWLIMYLFSLVINNLEIAQAFWTNLTSFHIWMIAFWILFTPLSFILWILGNILSRKHEYEADKYAKDNFWWDYLISGLKKLSINNLTNLKPHRVYEFIHYSHPTVLKRINALKK